MDDFRDIDEIFDIVDEVDDVRDILEARAPRRRRERLDPFTLPDREFKARFRFSKEGVTRLTNLVRGSLSHTTNRGIPFTAEQVVCSALDYLGGGHFQRIQGVCSGSARSTAHEMIYK